MSDLNFGFIGCVESSAAFLKSLLAAGHSPKFIVTKKNSKFNADHVDLTDLAGDIPVYYYDQADNKNEALEEYLLSQTADYLFCMGWSHILTPKMLNSVNKFSIGFHPAKLPNNKGRHPIIWALVLGLELTAVSFFEMKEEVDSGKILAQTDIEIAYEDTARSLYDKILSTGASTLTDLANKLAKGEIDLNSLPEQSGGNHWRKRNKGDGEIQWSEDSRTAYNLVRALTKPYVGAHLVYNKEDIIVWKVVERDESGEAGTVLSVNESKNSVIIACARGSLEILEHEFKSLPKVGEKL